MADKFYIDWIGVDEKKKHAEFDDEKTALLTLNNIRFLGLVNNGVNKKEMV